MSGSAAAKQLRQKHKKASPTKRKQFTFRKTRTQELADIRRASQKKVIQKLSQTFSHFSIDEEDATYTATPTTAETDAQLGLLDAIIEPPSSDSEQKKAKEAKAGTTKVEEETQEGTQQEGTQEGTKEETREETKEGTTKETKEGTTDEANKETEEGTKEGITDNNTTDNDNTTDDSDTKKDTDPSDPTTKETTEDETSEAPKTAPVLGTRKDTEAAAGEGEEAHKETKNTIMKKKVMTGFMSNMTSGMSKGLSRLGSMFGGKKKKERKAWKAVPGALPAGAKDVEYWKQLVAHYHQVLETKHSLPQNQTVAVGNNTDDESGVPSAVPPIGSSVFWAHFNLAMAHDCRGRQREAIPHYKQALASRPDNVGLRVRA